MDKDLGGSGERPTPKKNWDGAAQASVPPIFWEVVLLDVRQVRTDKNWCYEGVNFVVK